MGTVTRIDDVRRCRQAGRRRGPVGFDDRRARIRRYRQRAEELRAIATEVILKETCLTLRSLAESYEQMALAMETMTGDNV